MAPKTTDVTVRVLRWRSYPPLSGWAYVIITVLVLALCYCIEQAKPQCGIRTDQWLLSPVALPLFVSCTVGLYSRIAVTSCGHQLLYLHPVTVIATHTFWEIQAYP